MTKNKETGISGKAIPYIYSMGGLFLMEEKKTWAVGAGSGISWLKALLVSYLISVLLLLLLSFLLWKFSWKESWVQAGILIIVSAVFLPGGFAGAGRLLWAAAVCAVGGMAGGMTAHGR